MRKHTRNRFAFCPDVNQSSLEERLVLAASSGASVVTAQQIAQLHTALARVYRATEFAVRSQLQAQAHQLFAAGTSTAQQIADFEANAAGTIVAGTSAVANTFALLPGAQRQLVPRTVRALIASNRNSLLSRLENGFNNNRINSVGTLDTAIRQNVRSTFAGVHAQAAQFFWNTNFNQAVVQASDGSQSLSQFIGNRIITQFGNNLGNLALAVPSVANSVLFANGATTASTAATQQFNQMITPALSLAAFNLGNELQLLPNSASISPALQNALFATMNGTTTGTTNGNLSLLSALQGLPTNSVDFANAVPSTFSTGFNNATGVLSPFVGTTSTFALPTAATTSAFSPAFTGSSFQNGFLGGFGSGFTGFGVAPTAMNTNFGTGFNNFVNTANPAFGLTTPAVTVTSPTGTGVVGTVGVTTGTGATGIGTGTVTTGLGTGVTGIA